MSYNIGPKIGIEGEREFRNSIKQINSTYKTLEAETRAVTSAFDAQGDEQGKLEATVKQLKKQIEVQKEKMALLEGAVAKASEKFGENSMEAERLRGVFYDTQAAVSKLEGELKDTQACLDQTEQEMEDLEDSVEDAGNAAVNFGDILKANVISDVIMDGLKKLGDLAKDFLKGTIESAADMQAATAQFEQTFGALEDTARAALDSISDDTDIASTRMQGSFTKIYAFAKTAGSESGEALNIASRAMVAAADNAAYYDKSIEEATEQLQAFLKGNYANDAALGIAATETARNTMANQLYAKSFQELAESQKVDVLLAMVEAGNEASGAIGQAARESDSWENVTGELAEVMRLLQAEAGKPALKKLTPIIQKITKAGYKLIDEIDWDAFGDKVEDVIDTVVDHGPGIVKLLASITAGIVAMRVTQKVGQFASLAKSFVSVGTAAKTAGTMVAASGAAASATPWGAIAAVIGLAVTTITSLALQTEDTVSDLDRSVERLESSMDRAQSTFEETYSEINGAAEASKYYVTRLKELEEAGLDTAVAHREYEMCVEQLNELIPDLNLTIDEQTGLIDRNIEALEADIEAWKKNATAKAIQDKFTDVLEAQGRAKADLITAQAKLNTLERQGVDLLEKHKRIRQQLSEAIQDCEAAGVAYSKACCTDREKEALALYQEESLRVYELEQAFNACAAERVKNIDEQEKLAAEIENAKVVVASYEDEVANAEATLQLFNEQTVEGSENQQLLSDAAQSVKNALYDLAVKYDEAKVAARESIDTQIGLFEELTMESDWSKEKILENWQEQQKAFSGYSENLLKAVELGMDENLIAQLSDGSVESMQILDAMVSGTQEDIDRFNAEFARTEESRNALAETMAGIHADVDTELDAIIQDAENAGMEISAGAAEGVALGSGTFLDAIGDMAQQGINWFETIFDINSPSRVMEDEAVDVVGGAAGGIDKNAEQFERSMENLASAGYDAFLQERIDRAESYPDIVRSSTISNSSRTTNYGGINFQIYQQPGESAEDMYYRMMEMMKHDLEMKEAALR